MTFRFTLGLQRGAVLLAVSALAPSWAAAPGEDPVVLKQRVEVQMQPLSTDARSGYIEHGSGTQAWQQARMSRYLAKAYSGDTTGITTEKDVIQSVETKGGKTVCSQSVGSNAAAASGSASGKTGDQIVVLRGDLVNICW